MSDLIDWIGIVAVSIGPLWLIFHYVTKWKLAAKITPEDENLLDEMYSLARRLEDRVTTVERIVAADNPDFRPGLAAPAPTPSYSLDRRN